MINFAENDRFDTLRAFFAIMIPVDFYQSVDTLQNIILSFLPNVEATWTKLTNLHITLRFIPHLKQRDVLPVLDKLKPILTQYNTFDLQWKHINLFPLKDFSRILAYELKSSEQLNCLVQDINVVLSFFSYAKADFEFRPHLTLARLSQPIKASKLSNLFYPPLPNLPVSNIQLLESKNNSHYTSLGHISLKN